MMQIDLRDRLLADMHSGSDEAIVTATGGLFALGEYGLPAGSFLLKGGQAAFRLGRLADSAIFLLQGLKVVEPHTETWAHLLVTRAVVCAHYGLYSDAIAAGTEFLKSAHAFDQTKAWVPHAHHAIGLAHDRLREYGLAVPHHQASVDFYKPNTPARVIAQADLAYSLAFSGSVHQAFLILSGTCDVDDDRARFVLRGTKAIALCLQGHFAEALTEGEAAESLAAGHENEWASSLADVRYWMARAAWGIGDGYTASLKALWAAIVAQRCWQFKLCDDATDLLAEIRAKGGI